MKSNIMSTESKVKRVKKARLPRGLWVGKLRKSAERIEAEGLQPDDPDCYYPRWYYRVRRKGLPTKREVMPETVTTLEQAVAFGRAKLLAALTVKEAQEKLQVRGLRQKLDDLQSKRWCTVGQFIEVAEAIARRKNHQVTKRNSAALRLIIAVARGWKPAFALRLVGHEAICRKVDALPMDVVSAATRRAFVLASQVAAGVAVLGTDGRQDINWDKRTPPAVNRTINSTLKKAYCVLALCRKEDEAADLLVPWEVIEGFRNGRLPEPVKDVSEELPTREQVDQMLVAWRGLVERAPVDEQAGELALCNEMLRLLGLRSGEMVMARESWLVEKQGRTFLELCHRPAEGWTCKSATTGRLLLSEDLVARLRVRLAAARAAGRVNPFLLLPMLGEGAWDEETRRALELPERAKLVRVDHNGWLKGFIGEVRTRQGNHRLRKYVATQIYWGEMRAHHNHERAARKVKLYLRHDSEATSLLHYIAPRDEQEETVTDATLAAGWESAPGE